MDSASIENTNRLKPLNELSKYNDYSFNLLSYPVFAIITYRFNKTFQLLT